MREIDASLFTFHKETLTFTARMSSFVGSGVGKWTERRREGFIMLSDRTGRKVLCLWSGSKHDRSGRLLFERYLCYDLKGMLIDGPLAGAEVRLIND